MQPVPATDLYNLAVYSLLPVTIFVFVAGMFYRISRYVSTWKRPRASSPKRGKGFGGAVVGLIMTFLHPIIFSLKKERSMFTTGLLAMHVLGVIPLLFLLAHHVVWWAYFFPPYAALKPLAIPTSSVSSYLSLSAPVHPASSMSFDFVNTVWGPLTAVLNGDVLAVIATVAVGYKVLERIPKISGGRRYIRIGDFVALLLLFAIIVSGYVATHHMLGPDMSDYRTALGFHILTAEILVMILPFTKFFHFVFGYWYGKLHEWYDLVLRRGV